MSQSRKRGTIAKVTYFSETCIVAELMELYARFPPGEATFSFVDIAYHVSKNDDDKGKCRFVRINSRGGK